MSAYYKYQVLTYGNKSYAGDFNFLFSLSGHYNFKDEMKPQKM